MSLLSELRRRNVFRMALLYIAAAWFVLQIVDILLSTLGLGDWIDRFLFGLGIICFPLVMIFSYVYEITPQGLRKEHQVTKERSITRRTGRQIWRTTLVLLGLSLAMEIINWMTG